MHVTLVQEGSYRRESMPKQAYGQQNQSRKDVHGQPASEGKPYIPGQARRVGSDWTARHCLVQRRREAHLVCKERTQARRHLGLCYVQQEAAVALASVHMLCVAELDHTGLAWRLPCNKPRPPV
jgi:hypothetical protein